MPLPLFFTTILVLFLSLLSMLTQLSFSFWSFLITRYTKICRRPGQNHPEISDVPPPPQSSADASRNKALQSTRRGSVPLCRRLPRWGLGAESGELTPRTVLGGHHHLSLDLDNWVSRFEVGCLKKLAKNGCQCFFFPVQCPTCHINVQPVQHAPFFWLILGSCNHHNGTPLGWFFRIVFMTNQ